MSVKIKRIGNDTELDRILNRDFVSDARIGYVEVGEEKVCLPIYYENCEEKIRTFEVRDDDIFLIAHPKTGTTWLQEMLWLIVNNLNYEGAKEKIYHRTFQLEFQALFNIEKFLGVETDLFAVIDNAQSPRIIKSHLHWSLLPEQIRNGSKKPKIITIFRNPEDTCVSLYHYSKLMEGYKGTFEDFCKLFLGGRVCFGPFWTQVKSCWQHKDDPNFLFVKYKEMKDDLPREIRKVAEFLGKTLSDEQVEALTKHLSFDSMKNNSATNNLESNEDTQRMKDIGLTTERGDFIRSGKVGGYKSAMSPVLIEEFKIWTQQNLNGTGLTME